MEEGSLGAVRKGRRRGCRQDAPWEVRVWTGLSVSALLHLQDSREPACCGSQQFLGGPGSCGAQVSTPPASGSVLSAGLLVGGGNEKIVIRENLSL